MLKARLAFDLIKDDTPDFPLDNKVEPTFYNFGECDVFILQARLRPGESFQAGAVGFEMTGNIPVRFEGAGKKDCQCYYAVAQQQC